jgi:Na+-translocating ferredoxin:NAD+ oxidoreductase RnfD subunit
MTGPVQTPPTERQKAALLLLSIAIGWGALLLFLAPAFYFFGWRVRYAAGVSWIIGVVAGVVIYKAILDGYRRR